MLQKVPGCFLQIGGRQADTVHRVCHQSGYDFCDGILPVAMALWVRLVEHVFGVSLYPEDGFFPALPDVDAAQIAEFVDAMRGK